MIEWRGTLPLLSPQSAGRLLLNTAFWPEIRIEHCWLYSLTHHQWGEKSCSKQDYSNESHKTERKLRSFPWPPGVLGFQCSYKSFIAFEQFSVRDDGNFEIPFTFCSSGCRLVLYLRWTEKLARNLETRASGQ